MLMVPAKARKFRRDNSAEGRSDTGKPHGWISVRRFTASTIIWHAAARNEGLFEGCQPEWRGLRLFAISLHVTSSTQEERTRVLQRVHNYNYNVIACKMPALSRESR